VVEPRRRSKKRSKAGGSSSKKRSSDDRSTRKRSKTRSSGSKKTLGSKRKVGSKRKSTKRRRAREEEEPEEELEEEEELDEEEEDEEEEDDDEDRVGKKRIPKRRTSRDTDESPRKRGSKLKRSGSARKGGGAKKKKRSRSGSSATRGRRRQPEEEKEEGWGKTIAWVVVAVVFAGGMAVFNRGQDSADVQKEFRKIVANMPNYSQHKAYLNPILTAAHEKAFSSAYTAGGRRRAAKLDEDLYLKIAFKYVKDRATKDKKTDIVDACQGALSRLGP
jgi:hypothetical protein